MKKINKINLIRKEENYESKKNLNNKQNSNLHYRCCGYNSGFSAFGRRDVVKRIDAWRQIYGHGSIELAADNNQFSYWFPARAVSRKEEMVIDDMNPVIIP